MLLALMADDAKTGGVAAAAEKALSVGAAGAGIVLAAVAPGAGLVAAVVSAVPPAWGAAAGGLARHRQRKLLAWAEYLVDGDDSPAAFIDVVRSGLEEQRPIVCDAIMQGSRACEDSLCDDALVVIAALTRARIKEEIPDWFLRNAVAVVRQLAASEVDIVSRWMHEALGLESDRIAMHAEMEGKPDLTFTATQYSVLDPRVALTRAAEADRLFCYFKNCGLAFESAGYGVAASPSVMIIERRVVAWLADAMPRRVPTAPVG